MTIFMATALHSQMPGVNVNVTIERRCSGCGWGGIASDVFEVDVFLTGHQTLPDKRVYFGYIFNGFGVVFYPIETGYTSVRFEVTPYTGGQTQKGLLSMGHSGPLPFRFNLLPVPPGQQHMCR